MIFRTMPVRPFIALLLDPNRNSRKIQMTLALQIFVGLSTIMLLGLGGMSMFTPGRMVKSFAIEPVGIVGLSTIRSVIGGFFLANVMMLGFGLFTGQTIGFVAVAVLLGSVAFGRVIGIIADGFDKAVMPPLIVELVIVMTLISAHIQNVF